MCTFPLPPPHEDGSGTLDKDE
eukprot:COSAG02_NODE_10120_length_2017_cov_1.633472_1_plen_21_part_10